MSPTSRAAVFLDRDGVLNEALVTDGRPASPRRVEELRVIETARTACTQLRAHGLLLLVVTNQPEIARGTLSQAEAESINDVLRREVPVDSVYVCAHDDAAGCQCRKPKPGLLLTAAAEWDVDLTASFMVGDRWRDIEAGERAGCTTVFIDGHYAERRPSGFAMTGSSLADVTPWILARHAQSSAA